MQNEQYDIMDIHFIPNEYALNVVPLKMILIKNVNAAIFHPTTVHRGQGYSTPKMTI